MHMTIDSPAPGAPAAPGAGDADGSLGGRDPHGAPGAAPERLLARFGLERFRPGQREAVRAALDGRDSLVVMPTGGGKSLCYQLPALAFEERAGRAGGDLVVVVSPLIALMSDQWQRLRRAGVRASMLASGMRDGHNAQALADVESGVAQLVLAAPERFASGAFRRALASRRVGLFVVDEAHCVAEWGHDFRPDYLRLHDAIASLGRPPVMAATATATPRVAKEIAARLGLEEWVSIRSGFDRPNVTFDVVSVEGKGAVARKRAALMHVLADPAARPAIVYCGTRKDTDELALEIEREGMVTRGYHAGMTPEQRRDSQAAFMDGRAEVVVATNAFGMGVDKANVRTVAHWALPTSLEAYYQEAGRAGRDGGPSRALLLASRMDLGRLIRFIKERETSVEDVRGFVARLRASAVEDAAWASDELDRPDRPASAAGVEQPVATIGHGQLGERERVLLSIAERAGAVRLQPGGADGLLVTLTGKGSPRLAHAAIKAARDRGWEAYRSIERFSADGQTCRRRQILEHFGDAEPPAPSGRCCDVCDPDSALLRALEAAPTSTRARRSRVGPAAAAGSGRAGAGQAGSGAGRTAAHLPDLAHEQLEPVDTLTGTPSGAQAGERQLERLKAWRMERAEGKPAYTVATNAVLEQVLRTRPTNADGLLRIKGIGPALCEKHGESLLAALGEL
jgi:RecQ family ATP-dependent DNA helicase